MLPAISLAVFAVLYFSNLSVYLINFSYDAFTNLRSTEKKNDKVIIIGVDDASLQKYDKTRTGVLSKTLYSRLLDDMSFYSPAALAFDVIFELRGYGTEESELLNAVSRYKREVVFSSYFKTEFNFSKPVDVYVEPLRAPDMPTNLTYGCVNIFRGVSGDHDGVKRRYRPVIAGATVQADQFIGGNYPAGASSASGAGGTASVHINSLPAAVMGALYSMKRADDHERIDFFEKDSMKRHSSIALDNSIAFINYFGTHNNFHIIPIADLLEADEAQKALYRRLIKDRTVIVGSVSPVHRDFQDVPALSFNLFKRQKQEYGVIILANIIDSLLKGASIWRPSPSLEFAGGFLITLAASSVFSLISPIAGLAAFIALAVCLLFVCFIAFVSYGLLLNCFLALSSVFTLYAVVSLYKYYSISRESRILMSVLNKYVSPEVAKFITMLEVEQSNSGIKKVITVMFADIRGFTAMSENMDPKDISGLLNEYFNKMTAIIFKNKGTIDKFIGDAIMVLFGAPIDIDDAPLAAVRTALEMTRELKQMSLKWSDKTDQTLEIGIGINTGEAFIGNLGTDRHKEYSALGDTVNTAARLESHAKKGQILISESVLKCVADKIKYGALEPITLRGKSKQQEVFEVTALKED
jgi:adenylate cyclase